MGQALCRGRILTLAACPAGSPCLQQQAVSFPGTLGVILVSLHEVLVDGHGVFLVGGSAAAVMDGLRRPR
jgi:hypothetical protein